MCKYVYINFAGNLRFPQGFWAKPIACAQGLSSFAALTPALASPVPPSISKPLL